MTTNPPNYAQREGSLAERVQAFFRQHPEEELSRGDVALKFDVMADQVARLLKPLVDDQLVKLGPNEHNTRVYTAGPALRQAHAEKVSTITQALTGKPAPRTFNQVPLQELNFDALQVDHDVPLMGGAHMKGFTKWAPLFAKLQRPGASVEIPASWKTAVAAYATKLNQQHTKAGEPDRYAVRAMPNGKARVWRSA
jgi:hypothetical protein